MILKQSNTQQGDQFDYAEKRQQISDLELMITDFQRLADELDQQIKIEQQSSGISDVSHYAYPTFARSAIARRDNLLSSIAGLAERLHSAREELANSFQHVKSLEIATEFTQRQTRSVPARPSVRRKAHRVLGL